MSSVVELRQYTLHPGRRDELIELFDREFVEAQEACGIDVLGQFRDLDEPDRFVWVRRFPDMLRRRRALEAFYGGPVWAAHKDRANATMAEWSDVRLLRPLRAGSGLHADGTPRPPLDAPAASGCSFTVVLHPLRNLADAQDSYDREVVPSLALGRATALAAYRTETAENTYPRLPVRTGEEWLVTFAALAGGDDRLWSAGRARLREAGAQVLRLAPTPRSLIR